MTALVQRLPGHPIFGNLAEFRSDRIGFLTRIPGEYGDAVRARFGVFANILVVSSPSLVREVLVEKEDAFVKSLGLSLFARPILGNGLLTSEHGVHRRQRKMMAPTFMHQRIAGYAETIAACIERSAARLDRVDRVELSSEMMRLTLEIVGKALFGADTESDAEIVADALTIVMENIMTQVTSVLPLPPMIPSPGNLRAREAVKRLDEVVYRLIRERSAAPAERSDLLSMLLLAQDEDDGERMSDEQIRDEVMTIILAGHETTANALSWAFYLLAKNPEIRQRLEAEVDDALGGRAPSYQDLRQLPYALRVFKEAMRLYPPAYMMTRRATRAVTIGSCELRKNEIVLLDILGMHRRPDLYEDPLRFEPDRFLPEAEKARDRHAFLPFGGGPRICIGNQFALMEGQMALAHLAQRFRFDLVNGAKDIEREPLLTLRPKGGVHVTVRAEIPTPRDVGRDVAASGRIALNAC